jgi:hypothetical protein
MYGDVCQVMQRGLPGSEGFRPSWAEGADDMSAPR